MTIRTRLALTSLALVTGVVTSACGGGGAGGGADGAPTDASVKEFCDAQISLFEGLVGDVDNPQPPTPEQMADAVENWASTLEDVGTPEDISEEARAGFDNLLEQADDIDADSFSIDELEQLSKGGAGASEEAQQQATAFADYLEQTCGNPAENLGSQ